MKIAIVTAKGFGDGLMMMVASEQFRKAGHDVTTFNDHLPQLSEWFSNHQLHPQSTQLDSFDKIILQHDNTQKSNLIIAQYREKLHILYPSYDKNRHTPFTQNDYVLDNQKPLICEIARAIYSLFDLPYNIDNGLIIPGELKLTKQRGRVAIHPTSSTNARTWHLKKFVQVARWLYNRGFHPIFCMSEKERHELQHLIPSWIEVPKTSSLDEVAQLVASSHFVVGNESGIVHLASNLDIPFVVIAGNPKRIRQWQPGWRIGTVITPPSWVPNLKGLRLRDDYWQSFIHPFSVTQAIKTSIFNQF